MESDPLQLLRVVFELDLLVQFPEEARVGKPRGEDLAVAVHHHGGIGSRDIGGADESVGKLACTVLAHEVLLVHARCELDDLGRDVEIIFVEPAEQRHRPFGEACVLDHQPLVLDQRQAGSFGSLLGTFTDGVLPFLVVDDDMGCAKFLGVVVCPGNHDLAIRMEAMAARRIATGDTVDLAFDYFAAKQRNDARQRAHPAQAFGADRSRAPTHGLGPAEVANDCHNGVSKEVLHCPARLFDDRKVGRPALDLADLKLVARDAVLATEALYRLVRRALRRALGLFRYGFGRFG